MSLSSLIEDINAQVEEHVNGSMSAVHNLNLLGLDTRAAYVLYVSDEAIAVDKSNDRTLQYYGGFEYVEKDYRVEAGDYVFYLAEDDRVQNHIDSWSNDGEEADEE